ncbi:DUF2225 domain-containing protein [Ureibacillus sp. FSL K6-8385]|uniref:DUF2225 domain-containing protein n=1 Tax=Ureibacillus terrenus TaxID=118246 RepID=A0A540V556_9BACL|nr:DUF2225 domain-containing protein [Ureibacillus terrenus]MED3662849.1 DUF2225 domain-containing protein [Ureibacillus terrenus]MED3763833.1 DUF2225 domain-containing protein [Ureibacillus terrenus]TQE91273.1 DUF2225 domain-containing protein [Ureibacillus terrenus]
MSFNLDYYESKMVCNFCRKSYTTYKVRPGRFKVKGQDMDFMPIYEGVNPLLYEVAVCPHCGYAYHKSMTRTYGPFLSLAGESYINKLQKVMNLCRERTIDEAVASYQMAYLVAKASMEEELVLANFALKIAWLYRLKQDRMSEKRYLQSARDLFNKSRAANKESEEKIQYLVAEISLRLGDLAEAKRGFSRLLTGREISNKYRNFARKRWEEYKYQHQEAAENNINFL